MENIYEDDEDDQSSIENNSISTDVSTDGNLVVSAPVRLPSGLVSFIEPTPNLSRCQ